jgi:hypothetical protein
MRFRSLLAGAAVLFALVGFGGPARAEGPFGLGIILGSPTGVSAKVYFNKKNAVDLAVGGELLNEHGFLVHADYLWHPIMITEEEAFYLPLYIGIGGRILSRDLPNDGGQSTHIGIRLPVGILFDFKTVPIDVFLEVALVVDVIASDGDHVDFNAGVGVRYYF